MDRAHSLGYLEGYKKGWREGHIKGCEAQMRELESVHLAFTPQAPVPDDAAKLAAQPVSQRPPAALAAKSTLGSLAQPAPRRTTNGSGAHLPPGERAVLIAAAQFGGVEREQLTILTGYKRSSRDAYIQRLREKGMIVVTGNRIDMTEVGNAALPTDYEPLPTGNDLQEYWLRKLPEGEAKVLQVLIGAYPNGVDRDHIDAETGYKRSSRDAYLQRMKAKRLWEPHNGGVRASEVLFG